MKVRVEMSQMRWLSLVFLSLLVAGRIARAQDVAPPSDGMFQGAPPVDGQMTGIGPMQDMRDLMDWKKDHQNDPRVQAFDKSHGDLPRPTPGQAPDPSQFQKMQQYMDD